MRNLLSVASCTLLICCTPSSETTEPSAPAPDPVSLEDFQTELPLQVCGGIFGYPDANPGLQNITRIADEATCREKVGIEDVDWRWPDTKAAVSAGDLQFDELAAGRCLQSVAWGMGNGYWGWMNVPGCQDVVTGYLLEDASCLNRDLCQPGTYCDGNGECRTQNGCVDTHQCEEGEWCFGACAPIRPKGGAGAACTVFTDDGWPMNHCDLGFTCSLVGTACDSFVGGNGCVTPAAAGGDCAGDYDCEFGLVCERADCGELSMSGEPEVIVGTCIVP